MEYLLHLTNDSVKMDSHRPPVTDYSNNKNYKINNVNKYPFFSSLKY